MVLVVVVLVVFLIEEEEKEEEEKKKSLLQDFDYYNINLRTFIHSLSTTDKSRQSNSINRPINKNVNNPN